MFCPCFAMNGISVINRVNKMTYDLISDVVGGHITPYSNMPIPEHACFIQFVFHIAII
jgi:hypothetical protein